MCGWFKEKKQFIDKKKKKANFKTTSTTKTVLTVRNFYPSTLKLSNPTKDRQGNQQNVSKRMMDEGEVSVINLFANI